MFSTSKNRKRVFYFTVIVTVINYVSNRVHWKQVSKVRSLNIKQGSKPIRPSHTRKKLYRQSLSLVFVFQHIFCHVGYIDVGTLPDGPRQRVMILGIADVPENGVLILVIHRLHLGQILKINTVVSSVADPGCLSRIRIFPIPGSRVKKIPRSGSAWKNLSYLTQNIVSKLSEIWYGMFIPDPDLDFFTYPGFLCQKGTGSRILNTGRMDT